VARLGSRFGLAIVVAVAAVGFSVPVANASLLGLNNNCGPTSQPFAQFGDYRNYTFGTNGGLESGATGWSLAGASVVAGNETYYTHSRADTRSLSLPAGSTALTPGMCIGTTSTVSRFFARGSAGSSLKVQVVLRGLLGNVIGILDWSTISPPSSWAPGPAIINLDSLLGVVGVSSIQLKFTGLSGTSQVDDVWNDPLSSRD
jgi:hypothetical protein